MSTEESYSLIVSFPDQSESFVLGFEAGMVWEMMKATTTHFALTIHTANEEVLRRQAGASDKDVVFEATDYEGWSQMTVTDRLPLEIRKRSQLRIIKGGLAS